MAESVHLSNLVLTHFSPRYSNSPGSHTPITDIESEASQYYSGNLALAQDFLNCRLDREGRLGCRMASNFDFHTSKTEG